MERDAKKIVEALKKSGFTAYYAGGYVRDLLLKHPSDDIDIATSATPEEVMQLFKNCQAVGKAFGVVIVRLGESAFEVATFRKDADYLDGRRPSSVTYCMDQEDAMRRDFTINGLFYDPLEDRVIDYVGGAEDLNAGIIRAIGDPRVRFQEDRLRMIRAVRFATRFGFTIEPKTSKAILEMADQLLPAVSLERIWQELKKMSEQPTYFESLFLLKRLKLLDQLFEGAKLISLERKVSKNVGPIFPLVAWLNLSDQDLISSMEKLKVSNAEMKALDFALFARALFQQKTISDLDWVTFLANDDHNKWITLNPQIEEICRQNEDKLKPHIERRQKGESLISSTDLMERGVRPGKEMGELLKRAEELAIANDLHAKEEILKLLRL